MYDLYRTGCTWEAAVEEIRARFGHSCTRSTTRVRSLPGCCGERGLHRHRRPNGAGAGHRLERRNGRLCRRYRAGRRPASRHFIEPLQIEPDLLSSAMTTLGSELARRTTALAEAHLDSSPPLTGRSAGWSPVSTSHAARDVDAVQRHARRGEPGTACRRHHDQGRPDGLRCGADQTRVVGVRERRPPSQVLEVRVRTLYSGISAGTELAMYRGYPYLKRSTMPRRGFFQVSRRFLSRRRLGLFRGRGNRCVGRWCHRTRGRPGWWECATARAVAAERLVGHQLPANARSAGRHFRSGRRRRAECAAGLRCLHRGDRSCLRQGVIGLLATRCFARALRSSPST